MGSNPITSAKEVKVRSKPVIVESNTLRNRLAMILSKCYSKELSVCPKHLIFQPQKAINLILKELDKKRVLFTLLEIQHLIVALKEHYKDEWCTECESALPKLEALKSELEASK